MTLPAMPRLVTQLGTGSPTAGERGIMSEQSPGVAGTTPGMDNTWTRGAVMAKPTPLDTPCVETTYVRNRSGYGQVQRQGRLWYHHRWVWTQANGPIPEGLFVLHRCDNPPCVRLDHLFLGSHDDNMADMVGKDRQAKGDHVPAERRSRGDAHWTHRQPERLLRGDQSPRRLHSKLRPFIQDIRDRVRAGETQRAVARTYGVSPATICNIVAGKTGGPL